MGKDNIPFHTVIWPAIIMGMNSVKSGLPPSSIPESGEYALAYNVPSMEFLMLQGGQFSKSREHGVWLPSFLESHTADSLRYFLSINMPEGHDTDFRWEEFVDRVNNELIGTYGNYVHRIMTLTHRLPSDGTNPLLEFDKPDLHKDILDEIEGKLQSAINSLESQRFKEALRSIMNIAQIGNGLIQNAEPWRYLKAPPSLERNDSLSKLALGWRICKGLAITLRPFIPFQSNILWEMLGEENEMDTILYEDAFSPTHSIHWNPTPPQPLFQRLDLDEILKREVEIADSTNVHTDTNKEDEYIEFEDFLKVELKTGKVISVDDHPNADKLFVVTLEDAPNSTRTVCAGVKGIYSKDELIGKNVVFVANLKPRKLRGVMSEGMLLAADDGDGIVSLLTFEKDMPSGSQVR
jgi:methionyl-tRNA synthetase